MLQCDLLIGDIFCTKEFALLAALRRHQTMAHTLTERGATHCCEFCDFGCNDERKLCAHVRKKHRGHSISTFRHRQGHPVGDNEWLIGSADGLETTPSIFVPTAALLSLAYHRRLPEGLAMRERRSSFCRENEEQWIRVVMITFRV
uniref:C2H2-type domain-containing protein n=1 Tax=Globodera pallida TaxID=36090 RepID=A0A183CCR4_GLOPA